MLFLNLDSKLQLWVDEGLIDTKTAERLSEFESASSRPLLLWALTGLGALTILLGAGSLIAANWDTIPGLLRLSVHLAALIGMGAIHYWLQGRTDRDGGHWFADARLWLIGGLGLAFLFHLEEVYDRDLPLWQPMLAWLIGFSPLLLGQGRTVSIAIGWMLGLVVFALGFIAHRADLLGDMNMLPMAEGVLWAAILLLPSLAGLIALKNAARDNKDGDFWAQIAAIGLYWQFLIANYLYIWGVSFWPEEGAGLANLTVPLAIFVMLLSLATQLLVDRKEGRALLGIAGISAFLLLIAPVRPAEVAGALIFLLAWATIALLALAPGWKQIFQGAVAIIAIRLVVLTFELSDNLLSSGVGFILAGIALFVFASIAIRVGKAFPATRRDMQKDGEEA